MNNNEIIFFFSLTKINIFKLRILFLERSGVGLNAGKSTLNCSLIKFRTAVLVDMCNKNDVKSTEV